MKPHKKLLSLKDNGLLEVTLPEGVSQENLVYFLKEELKEKERSFYGLDIRISGRITTGMCLYMGHFLSHICKSVSIFDPKENKFLSIISHSTNIRLDSYCGFHSGNKFLAADGKFKMVKGTECNE